MQAIVLVGGEGTRLRPLTESVPKPALTLVDRPFLAYMIEWLGSHGVTEAVLACGFLPDQLRDALGEGEHAGVKLTYVTEPDRRGTAGAIRFAAEALGDRLDERFLALNGDVLTDLDLTGLQRAHAQHGAAGDARPLRGRGLLRLRAGRLRRAGRGARLHREDRRGGARADQRRRLRAGALGAGPDPGRPRGLDRARRVPEAGRRRPLRRAARRLLDGHRHAGALPAGDLGHPRGPGRDRRPRHLPRRLRRRRRHPVRLGPDRLPRRSSPPAARSPTPPRSRARSCSTAARSARAPGSPARSSPREPWWPPAPKSSARWSAPTSWSPPR